MKLNKKQIGIVIAVIIIAVAQFIPTTGDLSRAAISSMAIFLAAITFWICESFPMCIAALVLMVLMPYFGIMTLSQVWPYFGGSSFFFVIATFAITACVEGSTLPTRFIGWLVDISKGNSKTLIYGFMLGSAFLSAIMSNMATAIMFIKISLILIKANGDPERGKSNFAKCLLIGVPIASNFGGFMTIAGTPSNIMAVEILDSMLGVEITFAQWMMVGIPMGLISTLLCAFIITHVFKPEPLEPSAIEFYQSTKGALPPLTIKEKKSLAIIITMFVLWILGSWITAFNTAVVAIVGLTFTMFPGIDVLDWKEFSDKTDWNTCFVIGAIPVLVQGMVDTGASTWLVETAFAGIGNWHWYLVCLLVATFMALLRNFVPTGIANFALLSVPLIQLGQSCGTSPTALIMLAAYWCIVILMLPFDPIYLVAYNEGYYKINDTLKNGTPLTIALVFITAFLIPTMVKLFYGL